MNPYLAGVLLGLVLLLSFYFSGRGLGASGAMKRILIAGLKIVAPNHTSQNEFYNHYLANGQNPLKTWLVFEMLGVLVGGFISGALSHRLKLTMEHPPSITSRRRGINALIGGAIFGFGATMGRGCTSGAALSGMAVLAIHGFLATLFIFGSAFIFAYFFRKNWIGGA